MVSNSEGDGEHQEATKSRGQETSETQKIEVIQQQLVAGTPRGLSSNFCSLLLYSKETLWSMVSVTGDANDLDSQVMRHARGLRGHASLQPTLKTDMVLISPSLTCVKKAMLVPV